MLTLRQQILRELLTTGSVGGPAVADAFGVSRMAVSKAVASLRQDGYGIESRAGSGYTLAGLAPQLVPDEVAARVGSEFWGLVGGGHTVTSTNDLAMAAGRAGEAGPAVFLAAEQSAGRGRLGREWRSPVGGVYLSMLLRPSVEVGSIATLSLVAALAVADVATGAGIAPMVKWPNDVWADGDKLAGILLESQASTDGVDFVVVGIGVNPLATVRPADVAAGLLDAFAARYDRWLDYGFTPFADEFNLIELNLDTPVTVRNRNGELLAEGIAQGVDVHGRLLLRQPDGSVAATSSGEVTLRQPGR